MRILGIETSCDETGVAIYDQNQGLLANQLYSQKELHSTYGGVVPELAARDHVKKVVPLIRSVLIQTNLNSVDIDGIAYTAGPGLKSALLVGAAIAKSLAYSWKKPVLGIHHMEAHLLSPMLEITDITSFFKFPIIALLVSGGHTQLVYVKCIGEYKILGESVDDAVGEVFDKIAILLGLKYPGGALLSNMARFGKPGKYVFPRPMIHQSGLNFSFSGLKTAVTRSILSNLNDYQTRADIAHAFELAVVDTLVIRCQQALEQTGVKSLIISGGVSANFVLRKKFSKMIQALKGKLFFPKIEFCTDNAAMVALIGLIRMKTSVINNNDLSILVKPRWSLESLSKLNTDV